MSIRSKRHFQGVWNRSFSLWVVFWGAEKLFWQLPGVYTTAVGYINGITPNPSYEEVCTGMTGHTEAVLVVYEPDKISLEELLTVFWESHDPTQGMRQGNDNGTQYRSGIYVLNDEDKSLVEASKSNYQNKLNEAGYPANYNRSVSGARVLLCGAVSSAISCEKSERLLWFSRYRCELFSKIKFITLLF